MMIVFTRWIASSPRDEKNHDAQRATLTDLRLSQQKRERSNRHRQPKRNLGDVR